MNKESVMMKKKDLLNLTGLTILMYDYDNNFSLMKDENIKDFVNNNSDFINKLGDTKKDIFENLKNNSPFGKIEIFVSDDDTDLQVGITISEKNKRLTVIFRGTESYTDWKYDLMITKKKLDGNIYIHNGFYQQLYTNHNFDKIKNKLLLLLLEYPDYEINIIGHSLGGALSTLFGYLLAKTITNKVTVITLGSPRVGNYYFKLDFDSQTNLTHYRISNNRDVITSVPMINFYHTGINIHLTNDNLTIYDNYNYNRYFKFSLFNCWSVSDHNIELYYNRIKKLYNVQES